MSLSKRLLDLELKFMITRVWARHSLSLPGAAPPTPPAATPSRRRLGDPGGGRLPSAATGSAERSGRRKSFPGAEVFPRRRNGAWRETPFLGLDLASGEATRPSPRDEEEVNPDASPP